MDRIKIRLDIDGNLSPLDQMTSKFKEADKSLEDMISHLDKINNKSITVQIQEQIRGSRSNDPFFKKIDFMPDKSISSQKNVDILSSIKQQVENQKKQNVEETADLISGIVKTISGGHMLTALGAAIGSLFGPIGTAIGATIGKVTEKVLGTLGDILVSSMKKIGSLVIDFGKSVVESAAYRQDSLIALSKFTGSDESAKKEFDYVTRIADKTSFSTKQIADLTTRLFTLGFKSNEVDTLRGRALDIASLKSNNPLILEQYADAINKIKGKGKYNATVEQLDLIEKQLPGGVEGLRLQIGKDLGLKGKDKSILEQVDKLIKSGKVDATTGINAINHLIEKTLPGAPGSYSKEAALKSISGAISNVEDAFSNSLLRIDWNNSPGLKSFRGFLVNLSDVLGSKEFGRIIEDLAETLFKGFENIKKEDIVKWVEKFESAVLSLKPVIEDTWKTISEIISGEGSLLGSLTSGFAKVAGMIGELLVAGVLDALPGGSHDHLSSALDKYRQEQEDNKERAYLDKYLDREDKAEAARKRVEMGDSNFVEKKEGYNVVNKYYVKVDAKGRGKSVIKEVNAAAETARLASGR